MPLRGAKRCIAVAFTVLVTVALLPMLAANIAAAEAAPAQGRAAGQVVLIGVPGLRWSDLDERATPALWSLTEQSAAAALSVRTTQGHTCPTDGWLTVSAGQRARLPHGNCALPPAPALSGGSGSPAAVPAWPTIKADNADTSYQARIGLLGDTVQQGQGCTLAVGPGAVFGAADGNGRVDVYADSPARVPKDAWAGCALTVVEIDDVYRAHITAGVDPGGAPLPVSQDKQATAVKAADQRVAEVLAAVPATATILVIGLADIGSTPHLHVAMARGSAFGSGYLTSNATRQPRLVTLTDTTATILRTLALPHPADAVGSPWRTERTGRTGAENKVAELDDEDVAAQAVRRVQPAFFIVLFGGQLLLYGLATAALRRRWGGERQRVLAGTRLIALVGAAAPVASFLANLVPWWQATHPAGALIAGVVCWIGVVTALALGGPWRRSLVGPGLVIAGITALVLGLDVMTGSRLNLNALMGYTALVAGRFYGFGNQAFALFAVAALLSAAWLAERSVRAGHTRRAVAIVAGTGAAAVAIDGWPDWGSDFGGVLALVPAMAVLGLLIAGRRLSVRFLVACCLVGAVVVLAISALDAQRAEPSHLGRFWDDLVGGEAWSVIARKAGAMLRSLGYWPFTVAVAGALGFLFFVLARPLQWRAALLDRAYQYSPTLRPALMAALALAITGMLVNDSGVVVPAIAFSLAIPLALAASVRALELDGATSPPASTAARSAPTESPQAGRP